MDGVGFDKDTWAKLRTFRECCATPHDVNDSAAVFALGDTTNGRVIPMELPQPLIWWHDDAQIGAVCVQAEAHETEEGETLEVLGLVLPDGRTAIAFLEDVDLVDATDPIWIALLSETPADFEAAANDDEFLDDGFDNDDGYDDDREIP
jgi:hypothetical protein